MSTDLGVIVGRTNPRPFDQDDRFVQLDADGAKALVDKIMFSGVLS